jgi:hypothetical protein
MPQQSEREKQGALLSTQGGDEYQKMIAIIFCGAKGRSWQGRHCEER